MKIRIPNFIGRKLFFKFRKWEIRKQFTIRPVIRIESKFYTYPMKTRNYGEVPYIGVKYYLAIGGRKNEKKIYRVY